MIDIQRPVAEIVLDHPETAVVMHRHRIDYCCKGHVPLASACAARGTDAQTVLADLERAVCLRAGDPTVDPRSLGTRELIEHIMEVHHEHLRRSLPFLGALSIKVARVHGEREPRLRQLADKVAALRLALEPHLDEDERTLFPRLLVGKPDVATQTALASMVEDHLEIGELLAEIRALTDDYAVPTGACTSWRTLLGELAALEVDTVRQVHLENHVLAPRFR